jgi:hypothetical protein
MHSAAFFLPTVEALHFLFHLDNDVGIGAWFSTAQLLLIAVTCFLASQQARNASIRPLLRGFFFGFLFLSADEAARIHEGLSKLFETSDLWIYIYALLALCLAVAFSKQVWRFWKTYTRVATTFMVGLLFIILGAVGMELFRHDFAAAGKGFASFQIALEEFLEMSGGSVLLYGSLSLLISGEDKPSETKQKEILPLFRKV